MKTKLTIALAVPLLLAGVVLITPVLAANGPSPVFVDFAAGPAADASWVSVDETGCVETFVLVVASDSMRVRKPAGSPADAFKFSSANVYIQKFDHCTQTFLVLAEGYSDQ